MNRVNEIKEISSLSRSEIIHNNFFKELKKRDITNVRYAKDNSLDKTTLSKWKNMTTTMSIEQVYQAALYLKITVNDLYYSIAEKKRIHVLSINPDYIPIKAKHVVEIKMYEKQFKHPLYLLLLLFFIFVILTVITFFASKLSGFWMFLLFLIPILGYLYYKEEFSLKKTFIVDYLDDIYYKIDDSKNQYYAINLILHLISLFSAIISIVLLFQKNSFVDRNLETMTIFLLLGMILYMVANFFTLLTQQRYFKTEIYDNEISPHTSSMVNVFMAFLSLAIGICFLYQYFNDYWYVIMPLLATTIFSTGEYLLTTKKYSEYRMVFKEHNNEIKDLFPRE